MAQDTFAESDEELTRKKAIRIYMVLSIVQFVDGIGIIATSAVATRYNYIGFGAPYYSGGFIIGTMLMFSCLLGFRIYNKGPYFSSSDEAKDEVKCAMNWHRVTSLFMFLGSLIGLAIIWMFGFCIHTDTHCSFETDVQQNRALAFTMFGLGIIGICSSAVGIVLIRKFSTAFSIFLFTEAPGPWPSARYRHRNRSRNPVSDEQREIDARRHSQLQNNPFAFTGTIGEGVCNFAFEPPEPPPYTPPADSSPHGEPPPDFDMAVATPIPTISCSVDTVPQEPPPPYTERLQKLGDDFKIVFKCVLKSCYYISKDYLVPLVFKILVNIPTQQIKNTQLS